MTKILCAEDNADNLFMLQRRLTRAAGYAGMEISQHKPASGVPRRICVKVCS